MPDVRVLTHLVLHFSPQLSGDDVVCVCELLNKIQVYMLPYLLSLATGYSFHCFTFVRAMYV